MNSNRWREKALQAALLWVFCFHGTLLDGTVTTYAEVLDLRPDIKYVTRFSNNVYGVAGNNIIVSIDQGDFEETITNSVHFISTSVTLTTTSMDFVQTKTICGLASLDDSPGKRCIAVLVQNESSKEVYIAPTVGAESQPQALIFEVTPYVPSLTHYSSSFTTSSDQIIGIHSLPKQNLVLSNFGRLFLTTEEGKIFELDIASTGTIFRSIAYLPYRRGAWKLHGNYGKRNVNDFFVE